MLESVGMTGQAVRVRRQRLGISQRELARRAQITRACLGQLERGRTRPHRVTLEAALGARLDEGDAEGGE